MLIWFCFFCLVYFLIFKYEKAVQLKSKYINLGIILLVVVYYATFRDGLGPDYTAYKSYCERDVLRTSLLLLQEPLASIIEAFCFETQFSAVIFFFITSLIICASCIWIYSRYNNSYIALFVFFTYTNLYLMSFNLVRQFVAASLILIGSYYFIVKNRNPLFFLFVFVAFLFHKSALLFALIYFLRKDNYSPILWSIAIFSSWIINVQPLFDIPLIHDLFAAGDYLEYINHSEVSYSKTSLSNIYMHAITLFFIWNKERILMMKDCEHCLFSLKLVALSIILCNISAGSLAFAYRYAIFCSVYIPILFSFLPTLLKRDLVHMIVYVPLCILIWTLFYGSQDNRVYCPQRILPIESIWDENYKPYDNPDVIAI